MEIDRLSLIMELAEAFVGSQGYDENAQQQQNPVGEQLRLLGIDEFEISRLRRSGAKGLDIGCGDGGLVNAMILQGIDFIGIDDKAPDAFQFIMQNVTGNYPHEGSIPSPNESYDLVVAVQNGTFNCAYGKDDPCEKCQENGPPVIFEGMRVLKPQGRMVIFPNLYLGNGAFSRIVPDLKKQGITAVNEPVPEEYVRHHYALRDSGYEERDLFRTVLTKV
jgi:hypothetical protein